MMQHARHPATDVTRQRGQSTVAFLALGAALAVGLVLAAWIVASSLERIKLAGDKITVKGYAEEKVVSDAGTWRAIVSVRAPDLATAYSKLETDSARVEKYIGSVAGADADDDGVRPLHTGHPQDFLAVGLWLVYTGVTNVFEQMGMNGVLGPVSAIWSPIVIFSMLGVYLVSKVRT